MDDAWCILNYGRWMLDAEWCMMDDAWCMIHVGWCMTDDTKYMLDDGWWMKHDGLWTLDDRWIIDERCMLGEATMEHDGFCMIHFEWCMRDAGWMNGWMDGCMDGLEKGSGMAIRIGFVVREGREHPQWRNLPIPSRIRGPDVIILSRNRFLKKPCV